MRDVMEYDVVIVGAGPAGLSAAIHFKNLADAAGKNLSVCLLEKGTEVGAHLLSGAILDPRALTELIPDWQDAGAPVTLAASDEQFLYLTEKDAWKLPVPGPMKNHDNYIIRLGAFAKWLAARAEALGVEIYPGFSAIDTVTDDTGRVIGVITGDMGIAADGTPGPAHQPGIEIRGKYVLLSEGCRGSLSEKIMQKFNLRKDAAPQTYGLGIKEIWEVDSPLYKPGTVTHSIGWPLDSTTYGGSFIYHLDNNLVSVGFVVGLDYQNPTLDPFAEMQLFKTHPKIKPLFEGGKRISYGARALNEGGWQSLPTLAFPGGLLLGCAAGFLNVPRIKGIHTAMKSGMIAAESIVAAWDESPATLSDYEKKIKDSWMGVELYRARNIRPAFQKGLAAGMMMGALDHYLFRGRAPWTLKHSHPDHLSLKEVGELPKRVYPKPDGKLTFDKSSSVYLSNTNHREDQPKHLVLENTNLAIEVNLKRYGAPEQYYCPAGVYEIVEHEGAPALQINAQNCVHCKTCDIKDPKQNIKWCPPEGGGGPIYSDM